MGTKKENFCDESKSSYMRNEEFDREAWLKNRMENMRTKYNLSADSWENAPMPTALSSIKIQTTNISNGLWSTYGNGKLCERDSNARAGLRRKVNGL